MSDTSVREPVDAIPDLRGVSAEIRSILDDCLAGRELPWDKAVILAQARGRDLLGLCTVADHMRARQVGDQVTYVINRNINFTNVCIKNCKFCAFSRDLRSEYGYYLDTEEVIRRARQAARLGATEVCVQAGLVPDADGRIYIDLCRALKAAVPDLHLHAFSPEIEEHLLLPSVAVLCRKTSVLTSRISAGGSSCR